MPPSANGEILVHAILNPNSQEEQTPRSPNWWLIILGVPVAVLGFVQVLYPVELWDLLLRRHYQEDPSNFALHCIIRTGFSGIILGIGLILIGILV